MEIKNKNFFAMSFCDRPNAELGKYHKFLGSSLVKMCTEAKLKLTWG